MNKKVNLRLIIASIAIGILVGLTSDLFIRLLQLCTGFLWHSILPNAAHQPLMLITITTLGGLGMGICVHYFGKNKGVGFDAVLESYKKDGEFGLKQINRVVVNSFFGVISGASMGPEAPLITLSGYIGEVFAKFLRVGKKEVTAFVGIALGGSIGTLLNSPVAGPILFLERPPTEDSESNKLLIFASMISASVGFAIYYLLKAPFLSNEQLVPAGDGFKPLYLVYGFLVGIVGMIIGILMRESIKALKVLFDKYLPGSIFRGVITGVLIGIFGIIWPLSLFDGSKALSEIVTHATTYSVIALVILCIVKIVTTSISLSGGYQGGNIFPTLFASATAGLAIHGIFNFIPANVAVVGCMASALYVFMPLPLFAIFLITELSSFALIPVMAMALCSNYFLNFKKAN